MAPGKPSGGQRLQWCASPCCTAGGTDKQRAADSKPGAWVEDYTYTHIKQARLGGKPAKAWVAVPNIFYKWPREHYRRADHLGDVWETLAWWAVEEERGEYVIAIANMAVDWELALNAKWAAARARDWIVANARLKEISCQPLGPRLASDTAHAALVTQRGASLARGSTRIRRGLPATPLHRGESLFRTGGVSTTGATPLTRRGSG